MARIAARFLVAALAALGLGSCTAPPAPGPGSFAFAVVGDIPYQAHEETLLSEMMGRIDAEPLAFVVHVGDFKGGGPCTDDLYARRLAQLDGSAHALVYTPGDNDWTDCRSAGQDPLERLAKLRALFFPAGASLGRRRIAVAAQDACLAPPVEGCGCGALPENRAWAHGNVEFATLHVVGSADNTGVDARNDAEARCRREGNRRWLEGAVRRAASPRVKGLVVAMQANPIDALRPVYGELLAGVARAAAALRKPVLLVHGDTHSYRVDHPFAHVTRAETFGAPLVGWLKVTVDPGSEAVFGFEAKR